MSATNEMREESAKMIYRDGILIGFAKMNGSLKIYKCEEANYTEIEELFNSKQA